MTEQTYPTTITEALMSVSTHTDQGFTFVHEDDQDVHYPYQKLVSEARKVAAALARLGLKKGDRVALVIPDSHDFVISFFGCILLGALPVPLYPPLSLGRLDAYMRNMGQILTSAQAQAIVTAKRVQSLLWPLLDSVRSIKHLTTVEKLLSGPDEAFEPVAVVPDDPAFIQFTSGSTRDPRGVVVTHDNLVANCLCITRDGLQTRPYVDKGLSWLPLYHDMGLIGFVIAPLFVPLTVVFLPTLSFMKRPLQWLERIHQHRATITFAPNFAYSLVTRRVTEEHLRRWDLSCLRATGCGAEPISADTMRSFLSRFSPTGISPNVLLPCYGMAEATLTISFKPLGTPWRTDIVDGPLFRTEGKAVPVPPGSSDTLEFVSCGRWFPRHAVRILDEEGQPLPERFVGEIEFRGPSAAKTYFHNPQASADVFVDNAVLTGDLGYVADGDLYVSGRRKDLLIVNGRNYFPQAIEWTVGEIPGVRRGNVVAFARPGWNGTEELVIVCEVRTEEREALRGAIVRHVSGEFGLSIGEIVFLEPGMLPKTTSGKLQRLKTREKYVDGTLTKEGVRTPGQTEQMFKLTGHIMKAMASRVKHTVRQVLHSED